MTLLSKYYVASGALGFRCEGWWWEKPFFWTGLLDPKAFTVIVKTLTLNPRQGNLNHWLPWRCVRFIRNGVVNAVGLTNPGIDWWIENCYPYIMHKDYRVVPSITGTLDELPVMVVKLNRCKVAGIELNVSCPNTDHNDYISTSIEKVIKNTELPVTVKMGYSDPWLEVCREWNNKVSFDLINAVQWDLISSNRSPLTRYGLKGGVSGKKIKPFARSVLQIAKANGINNIISGGGIDCEYEVKWRFAHGADAVAFGTIFMKQPWLPNMIVSNEVTKRWRIGIDDGI